MVDNGASVTSSSSSTTTTPSTSTSLDQIYELITTDQHVGDVVLHALIKHPEWLGCIPEQRQWTLLHEIVNTVSC